jgi:hypothetical protein
MSTGISDFKYLLARYERMEKSEELTPWGRLASVAESTLVSCQVSGEPPTAAKFSTALEPYVRVEIIFARIEEARRTYTAILTARMEELHAELLVANRSIPISRQH